MSDMDGEYAFDKLLDRVETLNSERGALRHQLDEAREAQRVAERARDGREDHVERLTKALADRNDEIGKLQSEICSLKGTPGAVAPPPAVPYHDRKLTITRISDNVPF